MNQIIATLPIFTTHNPLRLNSIHNLAVW